MVLDIELFRADKGGNPDKIKENQAKRFKDVTLVDKVVTHDTQWRKSKFIDVWGEVQTVLCQYGTLEKIIYPIPRCWL